MVRFSSCPYYDDLYALYNGEFQFLDILIFALWLYVLSLQNNLYILKKKLNILYIIYAGCYAEAISCHGMDHYANKAKQSSKVIEGPLLNLL